MAEEGGGGGGRGGIYWSALPRGMIVSALIIIG